MERFVRPTLCRLCECPAGSDGVRMSDVDIVKLSRWWGKALETDFEDEELENKFFCQFCLWDTKFCAKHDSNDGCDWWTGFDTNQFYRKFYYEDQILVACEVRISPLPLIDAHDASVHKELVRSGRAAVTKCIYCCETFKTRNAAFRHSIQAHADIKRFACLHCHLNFLSEDEKKTHHKKLHPPAVMCHCCEKLVSPNSLLRHVLKNHSDPARNDFECCGERFSDVDALANHFKCVRRFKSVACVYCGISCLGRSKLNVHVKTYHEEVAIKCIYPVCGKFFLSEGGRRRHVAEAHESRSDVLQCPYCPLKIQRDGLHNHVTMQHLSEAVRCTFHSKCTTYFRSESQREEHERKVHLAAMLIKRPKCKECGRRCTNRIRLHKHLQGAHDMSIFVCSVRGCFEYFLSNSDLRTHSREQHHEDEAIKRFQCNQCSFQTKTRDSLKKHIYALHLLGDFQCGKCDAVFKFRRLLVQHIRLNHAEFKVCPHCHADAKNLKNHFRIDSCKKCGFVAACNGLRKVHSKNCKLQRDVK